MPSLHHRILLLAVVFALAGAGCNLGFAPTPLGDVGTPETDALETSDDDTEPDSEPPAPDPPLVCLPAACPSGCTTTWFDFGPSFEHPALPVVHVYEQLGVERFVLAVVEESVGLHLYGGALSEPPSIELEPMLFEVTTKPLSRTGMSGDYLPFTLSSDVAAVSPANALLQPPGELVPLSSGSAPTALDVGVPASGLSLLTWSIEGSFGGLRFRWGVNRSQAELEPFDDKTGSISKLVGSRVSPSGELELVTCDATEQSCLRLRYDNSPSASVLDFVDSTSLLPQRRLLRLLDGDSSDTGLLAESADLYWARSVFDATNAREQALARLPAAPKEARFGVHWSAEGQGLVDVLVTGDRLYIARFAPPSLTPVQLLEVLPSDFAMPARSPSLAMSSDGRALIAFVDGEGLVRMGIRSCPD